MQVTTNPWVQNFKILDYSYTLGHGLHAYRKCILACNCNNIVFTNNSNSNQCYESSKNVKNFTLSGWPINAFERVTTSTTFCAINASQDLISLPSFFSFTKPTTVWRREQEVETTILSAMQKDGILRLNKKSYAISHSKSSSRKRKIVCILHTYLYQ